MKPFRDRAKTFLTSIVNQRLHLIRMSDHRRLHNSDDLRRICEQVRNDLQLLASDQGFASYILRKRDDIHSLIPKPSRYNFTRRAAEFRELIDEASQITALCSNPQNLIR